MPVQPQLIVTAVQVNVCEQFFPVFAQLYLMKHAWLPTTQGISCSMLAELTVTGTNLSWICSEQKSCLLLIVPNREIYWRAWWRGGRIQVHNHHGCMLGFRETGLNKHALVKEYRAAKPGWPCTAIQLQKQTSACSYLRFLHLNDPGGRHNDSSVSPQGTWLLDVM